MNQFEDLLALLKSRTALLIIETREEPRVVDLLKRASLQARHRLYRWSIADGLSSVGELTRSDGPNCIEPAEILHHIYSLRLPGVFSLLDFHPYITEPKNIRLIKQIAQDSERNRQTIVFISHQIDLPDELKPFAARFEIRLPDEKELTDLVRLTFEKWCADNSNYQHALNDSVIRMFVNSLNGLTITEAERITRKALSDHGITPEVVNVIAKAKYELVNKGGVLYFEPNTAQFSEIGGLKKLKEWLHQRRPLFIGEQKIPGLNIPKGLLLLGVQGSGKSLAAKAVAGTWRVPLLRLDFGSLYDKYYGETERKTRESLKVAEQMAPCVLWIDEIEKGVATGDNDGGTSRRVLGTLLTWMAERKSSVFMVATANDIQSLPPELLRKGRLDEIFFVDLPDINVRKEILSIHLKKRGLSPADFDLQKLADACDGFAGAEIEQAVVSGLYAVIGSAGHLDNDLLLNEIRSTRPLSVVMAEQINAMREWASERTVAAN